MEPRVFGITVQITWPRVETLSYSILERFTPGKAPMNIAGPFGSFTWTLAFSSERRLRRQAGQRIYPSSASRCLMPQGSSANHVLFGRSRSWRKNMQTTGRLNALLAVTAAQSSGLGSISRIDINTTAHWLNSLGRQI